MLSRVEIQNFKSIGESGVDLELKPLTFLIGPNGSGKSSILEAIGVVAQGSPSGQSARLRSWRDLQHKRNSLPTMVDVIFGWQTESGTQVGYRLVVESGNYRLTTLVEDAERSDSVPITHVIQEFVNKSLRPETYLLSRNSSGLPVGVCC